MLPINFARRVLNEATSYRASNAKDGYFGWTDRYGMRQGGEFARAADKPIFLANW